MILLFRKIKSVKFIVVGGGLGGKKESGQLRFGGRERPFRAPLYELLFTILVLVVWIAFV